MAKRGRKRRKNDGQAGNTAPISSIKPAVDVVEMELVDEKPKKNGRGRRIVEPDNLCGVWLVSTEPRPCRRAHGHTGMHTALIRTDKGGAIWILSEQIIAKNVPSELEPKAKVKAVKAS